MSNFEQAWRAHEAIPVLATVGPRGQLNGEALSLKAREGHVYIVRIEGRTLTTLTGGTTDVIYIGQGTGSRVHQLWSVGHSLSQRLAWTGWAHRGATVTVRVEARADHTPELTEVELLNAFLWEHGQPPALNSRHEGWLPARLLEAAGRCLRDLHGPAVIWPDEARNGPPRQAATYTAVDLYRGASGPWLGSLRWLWPTAWSGVVAPGTGWPEGAFVMVASPTNRQGWEALSDGLFHRVVHPGSVRLGDPSFPGERLALREVVEAIAKEAGALLTNGGVDVARASVPRSQG